MFTRCRNLKSADAVEGQSLRFTLIGQKTFLSALFSISSRGSLVLLIAWAVSQCDPSQWGAFVLSSYVPPANACAPFPTCRLRLCYPCVFERPGAF